MADDGEGSLPKGMSRRERYLRPTAPGAVAATFARPNSRTLVRHIARRNEIPPDASSPPRVLTVAVPAHRRDVPETATVAKMISERLPPGLKLTAEVKEMILDGTRRVPPLASPAALRRGRVAARMPNCSWAP